MSFRLHHFSLLAAGCAVAALSGCVQQPVAPSLAEQYPDSQQLELPSYQPIANDLYAEQKQDQREVLRTGRYTLVSTTAQAGQSNLLEQTVQVRIPTRLQATVADGVKHTLDRSGYQLCSAKGKPALETLFSRPLPAAHYELGPMPLHAALQLLGGPSYQLQVEPVTREVCYGLRVARLTQATASDAAVAPPTSSSVLVSPVPDSPSLGGGQP